MKDLFDQKKYNNVVLLLEKLFKKLFIEMLKYKSVKVDENLNYRQLAILIPDYYPNYIQDIITLTHVEYREENTYLDVVYTMLSLYIFFENSYKEAN